MPEQGHERRTATGPMSDTAAGKSKLDRWVPFADSLSNQG